MAGYAPNTEPIYQALFNLAAGAQIGSAPAFKSSFRRPVPFSQLGQVAQPALRMQQLYEDYEADLNRPLIIKLYVRLWIFAQTGEPIDRVVAATPLNALKDAVVAAVAPSDFAYPNQTLGGLVANCWVQGHIDIVEDPNNSQGIVTIPVTILAMDAGC